LQRQRQPACWRSRGARALSRRCVTLPLSPSCSPSCCSCPLSSAPPVLASCHPLVLLSACTLATTVFRSISCRDEPKGVQHETSHGTWPTTAGMAYDCLVPILIPHLTPANFPLLSPPIQVYSIDIPVPPLKKAPVAIVPDIKEPPSPPVADATKDSSAQQQLQKDAAINEGDAARKMEQEGDAAPLSPADAAKEAGNKAFSELQHPPSLDSLLPCTLAPFPPSLFPAHPHCSPPTSTPIPAPMPRCLSASLPALCCRSPHHEP
jgi:hypothetical protein